MQSKPSDDFKCLALTENPYDWQFAIRGPNGTEFEGGIYHGRIQFSEERPDKPPIFTLLTENGRFKTQTEICFERSFSLSLRGRGPVKVREALLRLIELLPTYPDGALGSVEYDKEQRRALAIKSREAAPRYDTSERQKLIDEIHEYMLSKVPPVPSNGGGDIRLSSQNDRDGRQQDMVTKKRKRKQDINLIIGNTIIADSCKQEDPYDWQFAIRGPDGTEFEGGIYHGRIQFPDEYPDKLPIFTLLTKNGRFKTQTEINCFDSWVLPRFSVRIALLKLIELLPTYPDGALGSVEYDKEERRVLAIKSREAAPIYGTAERQKLIDEIHEYMLSKVPPVPSNTRQQDMVTQKRKRNEGNNFFIGNIIKADNCTRVGFFDFGKRLKSLWW